MSDKKRDDDPNLPKAARTARAREIDANLKRVYTAALDEEVPERFRLLLAQLREKERKS